MVLSSLIKQLKKQLKRKRRWLSLGIFLLLATGLLWVPQWISPHVKTTLWDPFTMIENQEESMDECIEDFSRCEGRYFGLDENGNLSMFEGLPKEKKVIRSFFQLDIEHLESSLPQEQINQLIEGIRITDFAEYNSVLSTFSEFAVEVHENGGKETEK